MATFQRATSWLFIKGQETIWVLRLEGDHLVVCGPGSGREHFAFAGDEEVETFQVSFAERLMATGWILWGVDRERRSGRERRVGARDAVDRRLPRPAMEDPAARGDWR